ncbi:hypothetical protein [Streptomyces sp. JJ36]|uniref:hypothetical protein n=1 Tax=Streptomyces sp. JJ36 TaxID=2736645 RepID=UPI001F3AFDBD|nr:hypothetical protein [Streptomyces sp. JJ36]MCF6526348.1 hypothetical protein [Streptomyces sp. JJ36]
MSRETDSSSSGPQGHGGPAYAPGTEPYGPAGGPAEPTDRASAGAGAEAGAPADEQKTETTLTTRIRINIPGSRPIPPVVMRKPVGEGEGDPGTGDGAAAEGAPGPEGSGGTGGAAPGTGGPGAAGAAGPAAGGASGGEGAKTSDWFAPRKPPRPAPEQGGPGPAPEPGTGPDRADRPGSAPYGPGLHAEGPEEHPRTPPDGVPTVPPEAAGPIRSSLADLDGPPPPGGPAAPTGPTGPTTGPGTGDMPLTPPPGAPLGPGAVGGPQGPGVPGPGEEPPAGSTLGLGTGRSAFPEGGRPPSSLYAQGGEAPGGRPGAPAGGGPEERVTSDTLVSGIPRVPSAESTGGFPVTPQPGAPAGAEEEPRDRGDRDQPPRPAKGRSKLMLVGAALIGVLGVAYGAGLLLDHADVPNGTTVLGVDIGGQDRQSAVNTLDDALATRMTAPITVVVEGERKELKPSVAGLTIDTEATVRAASGRDYNPVSVIGSLLGGPREAEAAIEVDRDKLRAALSGLSVDGGGAAQDGKVVFTGGKAKAVPGKEHKGIDVSGAAAKVEQAFRTRAATGENAPVPLPVTTQQPKIGEGELEAAVQGFGKTAMSGWVWLRAGDVEVPFSEQTIGTFLTMQPGEDTLVPVIDTAKLGETYGSAFDGVVIDAGSGTVEMTPKHAAAAMIEALREPAPPAPQKRVAEVEGARSR